MAYNIMIQGTMSNAGKSLLVGGLCRILWQDGYKVAPFKSQNMALNSFITEDGLEMGRAQVMQAEAAGTSPLVLMNPVLLKPTSDVGSQVIVNGKARGNMPAREYFKYKKKLVPDIMEAYRALEKEYDIIVIEGAGSPAEINLKSDDIVNMGLAKLVDAPVLLVGDIDRGGVFAQLYGTVALLEEEERARIRGMIINKFRGDVSLLEPGIAMLEDLCHIPVVGTVPYMHVDIDDEDSLSKRLLPKEKTQAVLDIAVIRLGHISNFTDFNPLESISGQVSLRYVEKPEDLHRPDLVILPGTKNTMADLARIRESGMEAQIKKYVAGGGVLLGICGGFQMLGEILEDPECTEGGGSMPGMGLLPLHTTFSREKITRQVNGSAGRLQNAAGEEMSHGAWELLQKADFSGYEIHMGQSRVISWEQPCQEKKVSCFCCLEDGTQDGCICGNVAGTYVHGLFESAKLSGSLIHMLLCNKYGENAGAEFLAAERLRDYGAYKQEQYDRLADIVRKNLDMEAIYRIIRI